MSEGIKCNFLTILKADKGTKQRYFCDLKAGKIYNWSAKSWECKAGTMDKCSPPKPQDSPSEGKGD